MTQIKGREDAGLYPFPYCRETGGTMARTIDILRTEHVNMSRLLGLLEHQIAKLERADNPNLELIKSITEYFDAFPRLCHHPKEDVIYRRLMARAPDKIADLSDLEDEHADVMTRLEEFIHALDNVLLEVQMPRRQFVEIARNFVVKERQHMAMEEREFFPAALASLKDRDWAAIDAELNDNNDPLFDAQVEDRFRNLRRELLAWGEEVA